MVATARQRARAELERVIKDTAGRHLAEQGAAGLSLRAVAREMGLASSALYRYYPSRDALLTALIVDAYDAIGEVAERAVADTPGERWLTVCRDVRAWAHAHRHAWALVYGTPVPGYSAPQDTVVAAVRLSRVVAALVVDAMRTGALRPAARPLPRRLVTETVVEVVGWRPEPPYEDLLERALTLVPALVGTVSYELFGHTVASFTDDAGWFDAAMAVAAEAVGLDVDLAATV